MADVFAVSDVSHWVVVRSEPQGRSGKEWLRDHGTPIADDTREHDWLFKPVVVQANGDRQGGDWSEKLVAELGRLIGVPCAEVRLAVREGVAGTISRNVTPDGWNLMPGSVLLAADLPDYVGGERLPGRPGHTLKNIRNALDGFGPPPGVSGLTAFDVFAGYLVLDAWAANQDRHDRNWAVLECTDSPAPRRLAASYDHTSSLGFNLQDRRREHILKAPKGVDGWACRGRADQFEHDPDDRKGARTLVELAHEALRYAGPVARTHWTARLAAVDRAAIASLVSRVPGLSELTTRFILGVLTTNQGRLLGDDR